MLNATGLAAQTLTTRQVDREVRRSAKNYVLNGIAYHAASRRLYVTGKKWDKMYQIRLVPTDHDEDYVRSNCNLG